jgi:phosphohistidine phosphatase SixA
VAKLYLVRHAHAGSRTAWDQPDGLRPLSERGLRQAEGLRDQLADAGLKRLISSPAVRCVDTLAPLAEALGIPVEVDERLAEGTPVGDALILLREVALAPAALCSHGDVIPDVLEAELAAGMRVRDELRWPKASTWVLSWNGEGATKAVFVPPPR